MSLRAEGAGFVRSTEFPPAGDPAGIVVELSDGIAVGSGRITSVVLPARPGVTVGELDALTAQLRRVLDGRVQLYGA